MPNVAFPFQGGPITNAKVMADGTDTQAVGRAIQITASVAGVVDLILTTGNAISVAVAIGDNIYPYSVKRATNNSATITAMYALW